MTFRFRRLAIAAGAVALPTAALTALLPATAAQAQDGCSASQVEVTYFDLATSCQGAGIMRYDPPPFIVSVCAGSDVFAFVQPELGAPRFVAPGECAPSPGIGPVDINVVPVEPS